jgi:ketosteroid isomerase-like protein
MTEIQRLSDLQSTREDISMSDAEELTRDSLIREIFDALDRADVDVFRTALADDVRVFFDNTGPVHGRDAFAALYAQFTGAIAGVRHELHELWRANRDPDVFVARLTVHYERKDGSCASLPCCNIFRFNYDQVAEYRVYVDVAPVFSDIAVQSTRQR